MKSPDEIASAQNNSSALPAIQTKSITSTVKKVINTKVEDCDAQSLRSTNAIHPAASVASGKPPMSTSKRSVYSSKIDSIQQADSAAHSPDKALLVAKQGITRDSPRRPVLLEPINNSNHPTAPSVQLKPTDSTPATQEKTEPA